jgi:hypothetical protein
MRMSKRCARLSNVPHNSNIRLEIYLNGIDSKGPTVRRRTLFEEGNGLKQTDEPITHTSADARKAVYEVLQDLLFLYTPEEVSQNHPTPPVDSPFPPHHLSASPPSKPKSVERESRSVKIKMDEVPEKAWWTRLTQLEKDNEIMKRQLDLELDIGAMVRQSANAWRVFEAKVRPLARQAATAAKNLKTAPMRWVERMRELNRQIEEEVARSQELAKNKELEGSRSWQGKPTERGTRF